MLLGLEERSLESLLAYMPMDRRLALASGVLLPDRTTGAALLADVSGFTQLTETLAGLYGPQRGAEEMTLHLNGIFDALIAEVHRYRGSVISFSGDAITCWFDGDNGHRATTCALAMQAVLAARAAIRLSNTATASLAMKAVVTHGSGRRFLVGDPDVQVLEVIAGAAVDRLATGEGLAGKGEVLIDAATEAALGDLAHCVEVRHDIASGDHFFVVTNVRRIAPAPWPSLVSAGLDQINLRAWLLPPVYDRLRSGEGEFLAELRPVASLFMRFQGIDYDADAEAGEKLDRLIRQAQVIVGRYEGHLLNVTIGDKGSYLFAAFGALIAHDDDAERAASAALELDALTTQYDFLETIQIGISRGRAWAGPYGATTCRTYGLIGDDVNIAARLMMASAAGQILVSRRLANTVDNHTFHALPDLRLKGRAEAVAVCELTGPREHRASRLTESKYTLPMVGRQAELALIEEKLDLALKRRGQIVAVTGEAGIGKSRLIAEVVRRAQSMGFDIYEGESQPYGTNTPYLIWNPIWRSLFDLDAKITVDEQIQTLEQELRRLDEAFVPRKPLLDAILGIPIPENDLTRSFDAKLRKTALEALLVACLKARLNKGKRQPSDHGWPKSSPTTNAPVLLVFEECQWLDALSDDLLEEIGRAITNLPVVIAMAYRPPEAGRAKPPKATRLPHSAVIPLVDFTTAEAERLIDLKLAQFSVTPDDPAALQAFKTFLTQRAQGNPFYIDEMINFLRDKGLDLLDPQSLEGLDLPDNLHSLILGRIDQLVDNERTVLKVASVLGRLFQPTWLWGAYPELGGRERVKLMLDQLKSMEIIIQDRPEPEITYLFKHVLTQEVAYQSLTYSTRARLHGTLARYLEALFADAVSSYLDLLAYHYSHSQDEDKQREYLRRAGEAAQAAFANLTAIDYYRRLLPLLTDLERIAILLKLGQVYEVMGHWQEAEGQYTQALTLAEQTQEQTGQARSKLALGVLLRKQGHYEQAMTRLTEAQAEFQALHDQAGLSLALHETGTLAAQQGDFSLAETRYQASLAIRRQISDLQGQSNSLNNLGIIARSRGDYAKARLLYEESLALNRQLGNRWSIANSLNNLANVVLDQGERDLARALHEEGLMIRREIGDRWAIANSLNNLGNVVRDQGEVNTAHALYAESIGIYREFGDRRALAYLLEDMGCLAVVETNPARALRLVGAADALRELIQSPLTPNEHRRLETVLAPARQALGEDLAVRLSQEGRDMDLDTALDFALTANKND